MSHDFESFRGFSFFFFFFFNDTATTEIYTLSLHDALPISRRCWPNCAPPDWKNNAVFSFRFFGLPCAVPRYPSSTHEPRRTDRDRKSTRLNSSHGYISYAVFCLKKKK